MQSIAYRFPVCYDSHGKHPCTEEAVMEKYSIGEIIRHLRKEQNLTQEELADGICSSVTVSRIESGTQMPSDRIINQLLDRLGSDLYQTANTSREKRDLQTEQRLNRIGMAVNSGDFGRSAALLSQIESDTITDARSKQLYILLKSSIALQDGTIPPQEIIEMLRQALALTKKDFSFTHFPDVLLTVTEANLLNALCAAYFQNKESEKAMALAEALSENLLRHQHAFRNDLELLLNALINLSQFMENEEAYEDALHICEQAVTISKESPYQVMFAELQYFKAKLLLKLGRREECRELLSIILPFMKLQGKAAFAQLAEELYQTL